MKIYNIKKTAAMLSLATAISLSGAATFAQSTDTNSSSTNSNRLPSIELTEEQKTEFVARAKERLQEELNSGRITQEQYNEKLAAINSGDFSALGKHGGKGPRMTEEQIAEREAMNTKWNNLTAAQKEEIYKLEDSKSAIDSQILDKLVQYGIISSDDATSMKENDAERRTDMRTNGKMPKFGGKGIRGGNDKGLGI